MNTGTFLGVDIGKSGNYAVGGGLCGDVAYELANLYGVRGNPREQPMRVWMNDSKDGLLIGLAGRLHQPQRSEQCKYQITEDEGSRGWMCPACGHRKHYTRRRLELTLADGVGSSVSEILWALVALLGR